jgi:uncharacterized damage-inducible protein DinB
MSRSEAMMNEWMRHRKPLIALVGMMEGADPNFAPWEGAMPLGKLVLHTATSTQMFVQAAKDGAFSRPPTLEASTMSEVARVLTQQTEQTQAMYASITDEQLDRELDASFMGIKAPAHVFLASMRDHEVHHKGQLYVYARMVGVEKPPFFISAT